MCTRTRRGGATMPKFVVYEVWTRASVIEADDYDHAYAKGEPELRKDLDLANWHAVLVDEKPAPRQGAGALNYQHKGWNPPR